MIKVMQTSHHDPTNESWGDSHRACLASILELDIADVPHFADGGPDVEEFGARVEDFLSEHNLVSVMVPYAGTLEDILHTIGTINPDLYYILAGETLDFKPHAVVCLNTEVAHNPAEHDALRTDGPREGDYFWAIFLGAAIAKGPLAPSNLIPFDKAKQAKLNGHANFNP